MDKAMIMEAFHRGLLSKEECTKLLGIDLNILIDEKNELGNILNIELKTRNNFAGSEIVE